MNTITLNKVLLNARPLNMRRRIVKDKDFIYKVLDREFTFSKTAGGKSIKSSNARIEAIKGNSVVWNNQSENSLSQDSPTQSLPIGSKLVQGHKYLMLAESITNCVLYLYYNIDGSNLRKRFDNTYSFFTSDASISANGLISGQGALWWFVLVQDSTVEYSANNVRLIDLTQMFGAEEAAKINTIEDYNARKPIVEDEYAFNEGQVIHCNTESIKSVGDNAWDEQWELGYINTSGLIDSDSRIRSKNFTRVIPNETYYFYGKYSYGIYFYDADKNYVTTLYVNNNKLQIPSNAMYLKFNFPIDYGTTYKADYMITLVHSGWKQDTDAGYQPYWQDILPLPIIRKYFPDGMKKAGTAHDEIRYNKASGKWEKVRRIGSVDMGTLSWIVVNKDALPNVFHAKIADIIKPSASADYLDGLLCTRYGISTKPAITNIDDMSMLRYNGFVYVKDTSCANLSELKSALQDVILYYESNDWEWVELDAEDQNFRDFDYQVWNGGTEQAIANVPSTPLKADIGYHILKNNLELTLNS